MEKLKGSNLRLIFANEHVNGKYSGQKHPPRGGGGALIQGSRKKNKGQISTLLFALLARSANVLHLLKKYTFLSFRLIKLPF